MSRLMPTLNVMQRILTIDGGGVRGVIPATLLAALEAQTGRLARESFDFVAGTSTGAVLAAGIAAGIPAERMARLYTERAPEIFRRVPLISWMRRIVRGHMYDTSALNRVLCEDLGDACSWLLNDAPIDLLITAKRVGDGMPWYFVRDNPSNSCRAGTYRLADAVTASAAAPTYFAPWRIGGIGELIDGGVGVAGNPAYQACVEAFEFTNVYRPADTQIISLGTGRLLHRDRPRWLWPWIGWLLSELLRSPAEQQTELVHRHYAEAAFFRIDVELERDIGLDETERLGELRLIGERLAAAVDWRGLLAGTDERFRVAHTSTKAREYCRLGSL